MFQILTSNAIILLPSPELADTRNQLNSVVLNRAMDGTVITYVRRISGSLRQYSFLLTRKKSIEYYQFMQRYLGQQVTILWLSETLVGYIKVNPVELDIVRRAVVCDSKEEVETGFTFQTI